MKKKYMFMVMMALVANHAGAQEVSLAGKVFGYTLLRDGVNASVFQNPAMQSFHYQHSLNTLNLGYDYRHASTPRDWKGGTGIDKPLSMWMPICIRVRLPFWVNA